MYFFTHLYISRTLYHVFCDKVDLDKHSFAYGNIKPDLPSVERKHHTLDNYLFEVRDQSSYLINCQSIPEKDFSVCLGEICHFVCDFFCYYHTNEKLHNKPLHHFFYELFMHFTLIRMGLTNKLPIRTEVEEPRKDFLSIILEMRKLYYTNSMSMKTDLEYAYSSCIWICESILYTMRQDSNTQITKTLEPYTILPLEGYNL